MARSSYTQSGFLGGLWSPLAQGRFDTPFYHQALNVNINAIIVEEGPWTRRSGSETLGPTYLRGAAKFLPFQSTAANPYLMEITSGSLRLWYGTGPVCTNDRQVLTASTSSAGTLSLTTTTNHGWAVGDHIIIYCPLTLAGADIAVVQGRHLKIATQDATTGLTANDDVGTPLPSDISSGGLIGATAIRILRFDSTGITTDLPDVRAIQAQTQSILLSSGAPAVLTVTTDIVAGSDADPVMSLAAAVFKDGPYLDPQPDTGTVSAYTGTITFTPASSTFVAADVGRCIRLFSEPAAWAVGTTYTNGQFVTDAQGEWWVFIYSSGLAGVIPGTSYNDPATKITYQPWAPAPGAGQWAWGKISAQATTSCTVILSTNLVSANGTTVSQWQLGVYMAGQYPTCGLYHEGRLLLMGAVRNRMDFSMSNLRPVGTADDGSIWFSPTDANGNVLDNSGISVTLNFDELTDIFWALPDHEGILLGTNGGIILVAASQLNDPITPTSIQAHKIGNDLAAQVEARRPGMAVVFVQRYRQRVIEYLADTLSGKFSGRHINEFAKDLAVSGIKELAYQEEKAPIIWALMNDGSLAGCTYRRVSRFVSEPPVMQAWCELGLGDSSTINTICVLPGIDGLGDSLYLSPVDSNGDHWVDMLRPIFEDA